MGTNTAYRTKDSTVISVWHEWTAAMRANSAERNSLTEEFGRRLYVRDRNPSRVVGFETFDGESSGDLLHDGALRVNRDGIAVPNLRKKVGKEMTARIDRLRSPKLKLPGMPDMHVSGVSTAGLHMMSPGLFLLKEDDGQEWIYALWGCENAPVDEDLWPSIPLSVYYAAKESYDAKQEG